MAAAVDMIRSTGPQKPKVGEMIKRYGDLRIHSQERRVERWTGHFTKHFN